jgi:hypothetical protein
MSYENILSLEAKTANIEKSRSGSLHNDVVVKGEKLRIHAEDRVVDVYSFQLNNYSVFKKKIIQLAINARLVGSRCSTDEVDYTLLIMGGLFLCVMTYVTIFK